MTILPILIAPDPILKITTKKIDIFDDALRGFLDDMLDTMYDAPGIGLAAPQVGILKSIFVLDIADADNQPQPLKFINPEIIKKSNELNIYEEGCLSFPEQFANVERPSIVDVKYMDEYGKIQEMHAGGLLATCIQHEIDHLHGIVFVDHISSLKRSMIMRKLNKLVK